MSTSEQIKSTLYPSMVLIKASLCRPIDRKPGDMNARSPAAHAHRVSRRFVMLS